MPLAGPLFLRGRRAVALTRHKRRWIALRTSHQKGEVGGSLLSFLTSIRLTPPFGGRGARGSRGRASNF